MKSFKDQVAVITGAASGLGFAIASKLSQEGVKLALLDFNGDKLHQIETQMITETKSFILDITDENQVHDTVEEIISYYGRLDILVNSAGITGKTSVQSHDTDTEDVRGVFDVNFFGSYFTAKHVLPYMIQQKYGRILHIASIAGKEGNAGMMAYSASKAAVIGMTKVQGKEYAETGITVNAIAPAVVQTAMVDALPDEQIKYMADKIPMKRFGTLEEVAHLVSYIVSPQNSFTTGFTFDLSGGRATY